MYILQGFLVHLYLYATLLLSNLEHNMSFLIYLTHKIVALISQFTFRCDDTRPQKGHQRHWELLMKAMKEPALGIGQKNCILTYGGETSLLFTVE